MKTKLQFIALASLAVMGAGCLAVTTGIIANEKEELSINAAQLEEKDSSYNIWTPGNAVYLAVDGAWNKDGANFAICYSNADGSTKIWTPLLDVIENYDLNIWGRAFTLFESVVPENPSDESWAYLIAVRLDTTGITSFDHKWNQTSDIYASQYSSRGNNLIVVTDTSGDNCYYTNEFKIEHEDRIATWGSTVNWWGPNNICKQDGVSTDFDQLKAGWEASAETFNALGYDVRAYFSNVQAMDEADPQAHNCNKLAAKYDYLVRKYGFTDFAQRL